jgi:hypothetical protein
MIKEFIYAPIVAIILLGFALQISQIAQSAGGKVVNYADDMNKALECAFNAQSIYNCSPNLSKYDFETDARDYKKINEQFLTNLNDAFQNATIITDNQTITIIIKENKEK